MNKIREYNITILNKILNKDDSIELENIIFTYSNKNKYCKIFYEKLGELIIDIKMYSYIINDIKLNKFDWNSSFYSEIKNKELQEIIKINEYSKGTEICKKCKNQQIYFYQKQTRSSDEPMTTFYTCQSCGNRWKE